MLAQNDLENFRCEKFIIVVSNSIVAYILSRAVGKAILMLPLLEFHHSWASHVLQRITTE